MNEKEFKLSLKELPEECKTLLDTLEVISAAKSATVKGVVEELENEKETLVRTMFDTEMLPQEADYILDNYNRVSRASDFIQKYCVAV